MWPCTAGVIVFHETHFLVKNKIEGQKVNCTTCHQHESAAKHFEVTQASCRHYHLANTSFNQGRARGEDEHEKHIDR
jgi:hypothetical protein